MISNRRLNQIVTELYIMCCLYVNQLYSNIYIYIYIYILYIYIIYYIYNIYIYFAVPKVVKPDYAHFSLL